MRLDNSTGTSETVYKETTMTAFLCSVSPPFPTDHQLLSMYSRNCYSSTSDVFQSSQSFKRVPSLSFKNPKSCLKLVSQTICDLSDSETEVTTVSELRTEKSSKKRVTFADHNGGVLTLIKYLKESTYDPPKSLTSENFLQNIMKNMNISPAKTEKAEEEELKLKFNQPVADYLKFKEKLEKDNVALENVAIKDDNCIHGTVKVKNISFEKVVTIRITFDDWKSHNCIPCDYVKSAYEIGNFDTFQFNVNVPKHSDSIQFCVSFKCTHGEFWDSNGGSNYVIARVNSQNRYKSQSNPVAIPQRNPISGSYPYPSTYSELPTPQERTWMQYDFGSPFY